MAQSLLQCDKRCLIDGCIHSVAWVLAAIFVTFLTNDSPARVAYGELSGWWFALYIGYVRNIRIPSVLIACPLYIAVGILAIYFDWTWFYKGLPSTVSWGYVVILFFGSLFFASPILINAIVRGLSRKFRLGV